MIEQIRKNWRFFVLGLSVFAGPVTYLMNHIIHTVIKRTHKLGALVREKQFLMVMLILLDDLHYDNLVQVKTNW